VKGVRLIGAVMVGALILAACSSSTPSSSSTTSGSGSSTTTATAPSTAGSGTGGAALSTVWPSCCAANLIAIGTTAQAVGNDVTQIGKNGGNGSTAQLVKDLGTFSSAVSAGAQASSTAVGQVSNPALTRYNTALSGLHTAVSHAVSACSTASNSCLNDIQTIDTKLSTVNTAATQLNAQIGAS